MRRKQKPRPHKRQNKHRKKLARRLQRKQNTRLWLDVLRRKDNTEKAKHPIPTDPVVHHPEAVAGDFMKWDFK